MNVCEEEWAVPLIRDVPSSSSSSVAHSVCMFLSWEQFKYTRREERGATLRAETCPTVLRGSGSGVRTSGSGEWTQHVDCPHSCRQSMKFTSRLLTEPPAGSQGLGAASPMDWRSSGCWAPSPRTSQGEMEEQPNAGFHSVHFLSDLHVEPHLSSSLSSQELMTRLCFLLGEATSSTASSPMEDRREKKVFRYSYTPCCH